MRAGKEDQPIQNGRPNFEQVQIRDSETGQLLGNVVVFRDPSLLSQAAWRELFRMHVFSESPAKIAIISHENEITQIGFDELWNLRGQPLRQRRDALNELAFQALDSQAVLIAREP